MGDVEEAILWKTVLQQNVILMGKILVVVPRDTVEINQNIV